MHRTTRLSLFPKYRLFFNNTKVEPGEAMGYFDSSFVPRIGEHVQFTDRMTDDHYVVKDVTIYRKDSTDTYTTVVVDVLPYK